MLREVLIDKLGERGHSADPVPAPKLLQRSLKRRPRVLLAGEATSLHPLTAATADSVAVRPE
jgi:hypothetical protein